VEVAAEEQQRAGITAHLEAGHSSQHEFMIACGQDIVELAVEPRQRPIEHGVP